MKGIKQAFAVLLLCVMVITLFAASFPTSPVKAVSGLAVANTCNNSATANPTVTCTLTVAATTDNIIVAIETAGGTQTVSTVADNKGGTYFLLWAQSYSTSDFPPSYTSGDVEIWYGNPGGTGATIITVTLTGGPITAGAEGLDVQGFNSGTLTWSCKQIGELASGTAHQTSGSCAYNSIFQLPVAGIFAGASVGAGTGFSAVLAAPVPCNGSCGAEYSLGTASSPTAFPFPSTGGSAGYGELGLIIQAVGGGITTQGQTAGSCPNKNTGTFTMVNNTIYLYAANALGSEVVNTVQVDVASITGSGSHTLELVIYVGTQQAINVNTPSALAFQYTKTFSTGTKNQLFTVQVNIPLNTAAAAPLPFNWWAVGVIGDNKIVLNQSTVAGLQTVTGSAPPANQPLSFTALSSNVNQIALCATATYQSLISSVVTTTQSASTTVSISTTVTSTISTIGSQLFSTSSNWPVIFLILLLPAGLFLGVTKNIAGALLGLMIGAIMGTMMGILPAWAFIGIVIALAAVAFIARERG